jgi:hypothetical protein
VRAWASSPAPTATRVRSCLSLRAVTLWARSPSSRVAFHSSGPRRVREATYLGALARKFDHVSGKGSVPRQNSLPSAPELAAQMCRTGARGWLSSGSGVAQPPALLVSQVVVYPVGVWPGLGAGMESGLE